MDAVLQTKCDQLIENYHRMLPGNRLESSSLLVAGAGMFLAKGVEVDPERLKECKRLLKKRKSVFSSFRGITEFVVRCKMALSDDPEAYLEQLDAVFRGLKSIYRGNQILLAAMVIVDLAAPAEHAAVIQKTRSLYKDMRKAHPWLTSEEDMPFAALMAVTGRDAASVYEDAEKAYEILKKDLRASSESRQMLSHILSIYRGSAERKCDKIRLIAEGLKRTKHPMGRDRYISMLGVLCTASPTPEDLVGMIGEADDYLRQSKPFRGLFGVGVSCRRMVAVQMTESVLNDNGMSGVADTAAVASMVSTSIEVTIITLILLYSLIVTSSSASSHR